jgi:hypothetical protein
LPRSTSQASTESTMAGSRSLTVRMYNVGFGDCFL